MAIRKVFGIRSFGGIRRYAAVLCGLQEGIVSRINTSFKIELTFSKTPSGSSGISHDVLMYPVIIRSILIAKLSGRRDRSLTIQQRMAWDILLFEYVCSFYLK